MQVEINFTFASFLSIICLFIVRESSAFREISRSRSFVAMLTGVNVFDFGHFIPFQVNMPKVKLLDSCKAQLYVREFPDEFRKTPNKELYGKICSAIANCEKRLESHQGSSKHKRMLSVIVGGSNICLFFIKFVFIVINCDQFSCNLLLVRCFRAKNWKNTTKKPKILRKFV